MISKNQEEKKLSKEQVALSEYLEKLVDPPRTFKRGEIVKGNVLRIEKNEMLVDVGGRTEGVVHGKELKLDGEVLDKKTGDEVLVYILKPENDHGQIELSIRRTGVARKWFELINAKEKDEPVTVTVTEANTGGVIVNIGGGLRGFIPMSQLDSKRIYAGGGYKDKSSASKAVQDKLGDLVGEEIDVKVIEIDREKNRVILSEKQLKSGDDAELREETLKNTEVGDVLEGRVTGITPFGLFVNAQGLEGLVHLSQISWDKVSDPADFYNIGDEVRVEVIGMQDNGKRVAYSIKKLQKDPWDEIIEEYKVGMKVQGVVNKVIDYGAFVRIDDKVNGLIHISEMSDKLVRDPRDYVKIGDSVDLEIISISRDERHLGLSMKSVKKDDEEVTSVPDKSEKEVEIEVKDQSQEIESKEQKEDSIKSRARELESLSKILED